MIDTVIQKVDDILSKANFERLVFSSPKKTKYCFDLLVKKENLVFIVKVFSNIDNLNADIIKDIKALSLLLNSKPLLIGIKNRHQNLEENTIYIREDLPFINMSTFEKMINHNLFPYILSKRGGGVIFLDGNLMKSMREQRNLSRKELSLELGVTKRTLCAYENESMRPSQQIAKKILDILEDSSLFRKINLFDWNIKLNFLNRDDVEEKELNPFEMHLQDIIDDIGISAYWYKKGQVPFELSLYSKNTILEINEDFYPLFSRVPDKPNKINDQNLKSLMMFSQLYHKRALFIVNNDFKVPDSVIKQNIPFIKVRSLEKIDNEEDFVEFIQETGS